MKIHSDANGKSKTLLVILKWCQTVNGLMMKCGQDSVSSLQFLRGSMESFCYHAHGVIVEDSFWYHTTHRFLFFIFVVVTDELLR